MNPHSTPTEINIHTPLIPSHAPLAYHLRLLYVLVILSHDRRKVVHFNVTDHPTCQWTIRQVKAAF
jgi:hypothetical protein